MGANPETGQPIPFPVFAQPNVGPGVMMQPGQDYTFPGAEYVDEFPQVKKGGLVKQPKKYSKSLMAKNILFVKNALLSKKKSAKNKIFDPNSPYFQDGGTFEIELDENEIDQYRKGGYIVEDVEYDKGGSSGCPKGEYWNGTKCVKIPKNTRIVYHTDKDVYDKAFAAESDSSHFYNTAKSDFNKFDKLSNRFSTPMSYPEWKKVSDQYYKLLDSQKNKWHTDEYRRDIYTPNYTVNYKYKGPKSGLTIKPVGLEKGFYREGYKFPRFKKPVVHNVYEEPIKQPLPTTRTVYIDCPPGSVANGQKTDVTTHDPDSPGNYLRTITTGCDPIKEKEVIVPIKEPVKSTEEVPMDTQEYPEELEGPNWEWDKKWHSFNTPRLNKHFPLGPLFNGKKKHTFSTPYLHRRKDYEDGGIIGDFSTNQIQEYINGGYIVEELDAYAKGGSSSCPKDHVWDSNTKKCVKVYTLANDKKLIDGVSNWAMQSNDPDKISSEYNDQIKHYLYSGKYGYDPVSGTLYPLKKEQKTVADAETKKILAKQDDKAAYTQSIIDAGFDPDTFGKSKGTNVITGEEIYGDKSQEDIDKINKEAVNDFVTEGQRKAILESPFNTAAFFTPAGMAAGVMQGAANLLPDAYDFVKDPSWSGAGAVGMDALMMSPAAKGLGKALSFKGVPKELPGSPNVSTTNNVDDLVDLWRIQEKNGKTFAQLAEEGKINPLFNNPATLAKKAEEEKYFGQWFTKDKNDFNFYKADREFTNPEIINLKIPKSKLEQYSQYDKSLSRAPDREFVIPFEEQKLYKELPGSPNAASSVDDVGKVIPYNPPSNTLLENAVPWNKINTVDKRILNYPRLVTPPKRVYRTTWNPTDVKGYEKEVLLRDIAEAGKRPITSTTSAKKAALEDAMNAYNHGSDVNVGLSTTTLKNDALGLVGKADLSVPGYYSRPLRDDSGYKNATSYLANYKVKPGAKILDADDYYALRETLKKQGKSQKQIAEILKDNGFAGVKKWHNSDEIQWLNPKENLSLKKFKKLPASQIPQNKYGGLNKLKEEEGMILDLSLEEIEEYKKGGYVIEDISVPSLTRMDNGAQVKGLQGLNADFSTSLTAFINAAKADGIDLGIGSGFRSVEKQKQLWEQALKKYGTPEKARKWVAPPGRSNHNRGTAVDLNSSGAFLGKNKNTKATQWAHANAEKFGLHFRMGHEPWHIEPLNLSKEQKAKIDAEHQHSDNEDPNTHVDPNNVKALSKEGIDMTKYYKNLGKEQEITDIDNDYSNWNPQEEVIVDPRIAQLEAYSKLMSPSIQNVNDMYAATKVNQQQQQKQFAMGGYIDTELTDKEITNYKNGGYIVEYLD
jgi:LAS superfamily LD-carboxypeptidase LdcB